MALAQGTSTEIALNVTRTRVTVLVFNLTIISFMLSIIHGASADPDVSAHLTTTVALFVGFCLTLLGLWWLLWSQNWDAQGLSRPWPFTLGAMTNYLALSQTVTAFMHEYLFLIESTLETSRFDASGDPALLALFIMGGGVWALTTYIAPLITGLKNPAVGGSRWWVAGYYFALQIPIYWVYARAWQLAYVPADQPVSMLKLFALQFAQPLLWLR